MTNANEKPSPSEKINHSLLPEISVFKMVVFYIQIHFIITLKNVSHFIELCFWQTHHLYYYPQQFILASLQHIQQLFLSPLNF